MNLTCPHCHNPIELAPETAAREILCPACGSSFRLELGTTAGWNPDDDKRCLGRFELIEPVGTGSFGTVYKASDTALDRIVALKIPRAGNLASSGDLDRFLREARSVAQLRHPAIVPVHEVGQEDGVPYLVSDFVEGVTLADVLTARQPGPQEAAQLIAAVAEALQYAHEQGVVHRDIKPSNIMLDSSGQPHVMDFGLAKRDAGEVTMTIDGQVLGTPAYMSPEQARGEAHKVDGRGDIYSLGVILYQLLTGELPFRGNARMLIHQVLHAEPRSPRSLNDRIPRNLETICLKAMAKEPGRRYQTAGELAADLHRFLKGEPIRARPVGQTERLWRWCVRNPLVAVLTAGVAALLIAAAFAATAIAFHLKGRADHERTLADQARAAQVAEQAERAKAVAAKEQAVGLALTASSSAALGEDPTLALLLAIEGASRVRDLRANNALLAALEACHEERVLAGHDTAVTSTVYSKDGQRLLTVSRDAARLWSAEGEQISTLKPPAPIATAQLSPDGRWVAIIYVPTILEFSDRTARVYTNRVVHLWDASAGKEVRQMKGHQDTITSIDFNPDGRRLVTASHDRTARVWDAVTGKELALLGPHGTSLVFATFSPDGQRVVTTALGYTLSGKLPENPTGFEVLVDPEPKETPAQDKRVVIRVGGWPQSVNSYQGEDMLARIWDVASGKVVGAVEKPSSSMQLFPYFSTFSPSERRGLTVALETRFPFGMRGIVSIWGDASSRVIATIRNIDLDFETYGDHLSARFSFSPDGQRLLTISDKTARIWDALTGKEITAFEGHSRPIRSGRFSPDGQWVVTTSEDRSARVWNAATAVEVLALKGHHQTVTSAAFSPDGRHIVTTSADRTTRLWSAATFNNHVVCLQEKNRERVALMTTLLENTVFSPAFPQHQSRSVRSVVFSPDGRRVATAQDDKTARIWDAATGQELAVLKGLKQIGNSTLRDRMLGQVRWMSFSPDGKMLLTVSGDVKARYRPSSFLGWGQGPEKEIFTPVRLWDTETGKEKLALKGEKCQILSAVFSPDGRYVLATEGNSEVHFAAETPSIISREEPKAAARLYDAVTGKEILALKDHQEAITAAAFTPDGRCLLTAAGEVCVWDATTGHKVSRLNEPPGQAIGARRLGLFSPDGKRVLTADVHQGRLWDIATGNELGVLEGDNAFPPHYAYGENIKMRTFAFSRDGSLVAAACGGDRVRIWDATTGKQRALLQGHHREIHSVQFSPDGRQVVTASEDETARIWDTESGNELFTLTGHQGAVLAATFSPDGKRVGTASADGTARIWTLDLLPIARARKPRELTAQERQRYGIAPSEK